MPESTSSASPTEEQAGWTSPDIDTLDIVGANIFTSGAYSDFEIHCGAKVFKVHKVIICSQVEFFAKACDGPFLEAQTGLLRLDDDEPTAVEAFIEYLYKHRCDDILAKCPVDTYLCFYISVYKIAEKYGCRSLSEWILRQCDFMTVSDLSTYAGDYNHVSVTGFMAALISFTDSPAEQRDRLRESIMDIAVRNFQELMNNNDFLELLKVESWIAVEFLVHARNSSTRNCNKGRSFHKVRCMDCNSSFGVGSGSGFFLAVREEDPTPAMMGW